MKHDPDANQGRGPKPERISLGEWVLLTVCAFLIGWVVLAAVGVSK